MRVIIVLLYCIIFSTLDAQNDNTIHQYGTFYTYNNVDTLARFPGGEDELFTFFEYRIHPTHLIKGEEENNVFRVILVLHISELGFLDSSRFEYNTNVYLERQINRALEEMPPWMPAKKDGITTSSSVYIPMLIVNEDGIFRVTKDPSGFSVTQNKGFSLLKAILFVGTIATFLIIWSH